MGRPTRTRLMVAAYNGRVDVVKKYVQQQAGKQDYRGLTAMMYAMAAGHIECVKVLEPYEAHIQPPECYSALKVAKQQDEREILSKLQTTQLTTGASTSIVAHSQNTRGDECARSVRTKGGVGNIGGESANFPDTSKREGSSAMRVSPRPTPVQRSESYYTQTQASLGHHSGSPSTTSVDTNPNQQNLRAGTTRGYQKDNGDGVRGGSVNPGQPEIQNQQHQFGTNAHPQRQSSASNITSGQSQANHGVNSLGNQPDKTANDPSNVPQGRSTETEGKSDVHSSSTQKDRSLISAVLRGDLQGVRENLGQVGKQNEEGRTALMHAADNGNLECVKLLLSELGMKMTKECQITLDGTTFTFNSGTTALMMAAARGHSNLIPILEREIGMRDNYGWTALMWAAHNGKLECTELLLSEVGMQNNYGGTALMKAAWGGHSNIIPLLERELGMQRNDGWTALMLAAYNGKTDCTRLLLSEAGKQLTKESSRFPPGTTALMIAAQFNYPEIVELLLPYEQGLKDSNGNTAKWYANNSSEEGDFTKVRKLLENEGTERIPPPPNPAEMLKLSRENESLKKELSSTKNAREEADERLAQLNREVSSLKEQLNKTIEERDALRTQLEDEKKQGKARNDKFSAEVESLQEQLSRSHTDSESLKRELANQKDKNISLEEENAQLKNESQDVKNLQAKLDDLQRRVEEMEEEKNALLKNLAEVGGKPNPTQETGSLISSAIQGDPKAIRKHLDQAGQQDPRRDDSPDAHRLTRPD